MAAKAAPRCIAVQQVDARLNEISRRVAAGAITSCIHAFMLGLAIKIPKCITKRTIFTIIYITQQMGDPAKWDESSILQREDWLRWAWYDWLLVIDWKSHLHQSCSKKNWKQFHHTTLNKQALGRWVRKLITWGQLRTKVDDKPK